MVIGCPACASRAAKRVASAPVPVNITGTPVITQPATNVIASGGGSTTFDVDYVVAAAGSFSFTITFGSDATGGQSGPSYEIQISGLPIHVCAYT